MSQTPRQVAVVADERKAVFCPAVKFSDCLAGLGQVAGRLQSPKAKFPVLFARFSQLIHRVVGVVGSPVVGRSINFEGNAQNVSVSKGRLAVAAVRVVDLFVFRRSLSSYWFRSCRCIVATAHFAVQSERLGRQTRLAYLLSSSA